MSNSTSNFRHIKMQIQRRVKQCLAIANQHFQQEFIPPRINYNLEGVKAGVAYLQANEIRLNKTLLLENSDEFIQQVVPHELAHLLVFQLFGHVKPHGTEWKNMMKQVFHLPADTCHQFDIRNVSGATFSYACSCQTHQLTIRRHRRVVNQQVEYFCRKCKTKLMAYAAE